MKDQKLAIIGRNATVEFVGHTNAVLAKVDTGADSSSVWASDVSVDKNGMLHFTLFDKASELYTGEKITRKDFRVAQVKSSSGHTQIRYQVKLSIRLEGRRIRAFFNLSDRSRNQYPVLVGRRTIARKFLVDVSLSEVEKPAAKTEGLNKELQKNPHLFFTKYHKENVE